MMISRLTDFLQCDFAQTLVDSSGTLGVSNNRKHHMLSKLVLSVVVAVIVTLACILLGGILVALKVDIAITIGEFLKDYAGVLGVLAGLWHFFAGGGFNFTPRT